MNGNDDRSAFEKAMRDVKPLARKPRVAVSRPRRRALTEPRRVTGAAAAIVTDGERATFRRETVPEPTLLELARGRIRADDEADLHGLTADEAQIALARFIAEALAQGRRSVRIVHGKGRRSGPGGPVLKGLVHRWLAENEAVLAFTTADARHGGTGATCVLLGSR
jgi:DNA-nicking Smr family endonuclease